VDGTYQANGLEEPGEAGLAGLRVRLGTGACPGAEYAQTASDAEGNFSFETLPDGRYCLTIDANDAANAPILGIGRWTLPASASMLAQAWREVTVAPGRTHRRTGLRWDINGQPVPTAAPPTPTAISTPAGCTDLVGFVSDVTIPDGSPVVAGEAFRKTWRLRNDGTCTWTPAMPWFFSSGERMGGAAVVPFTTTIRPAATVDVSVDLVAPSSRGSYRGYWLLRNDRGLLFGMPSTGVNPIWVEVVVARPGSTVTGGWTAEYFANRTLSGSPALTRRDLAVDFAWEAAGPTRRCHPTPSRALDRSDGL